MTTQQEAGAIMTITQNYSFEQQREILVEECAELIQAAQKMKRNSADLTAYNNFIEEIADVSIMIDQMFAYIGPRHISTIREKKLQRQMERIENERSELSRSFSSAPFGIYTEEGYKYLNRTYSKNKENERSDYV